MVRYRSNTSKYNNHKTTVDGIEFDSKKEARRYSELRLLERAGQITNLQRQVKFCLIPTQYEPDIIGPRGGTKKGKRIECECAYIADFTYVKNGELIVEDTKGYKTKDYIIKRKLLLYLMGIRIHEV